MTQIFDFSLFSCRFQRFLRISLFSCTFFGLGPPLDCSEIITPGGVFFFQAVKAGQLRQPAFTAGARAPHKQTQPFVSPRFICSNNSQNSQHLDSPMEENRAHNPGGEGSSPLLGDFFSNIFGVGFSRTSSGSVFFEHLSALRVSGAVFLVHLRFLG